jgi:hypothetical protein
MIIVLLGQLSFRFHKIHERFRVRKELIAAEE